jgi:hypothetical protein
MFTQAEETVERWGVYEVKLSGPSSGNPFTDVELSATFEHVGTTSHVSDATSLTVHGFYDGDGKYLVRFSPPSEGVWKYATTSNADALKGKSGSVTVTAPGVNNHGPVAVHNTFHFAYADGKHYVPVGTTCYAWTHQAMELQELTLKTLKDAPFNKLRMCVFPKHYAYNTTEPPFYPFEGKAPRDWDLTRFNPAFFHHLEKRIQELGELGIEADLILFHPYDEGRWGFDRMPSDADDRYLKYTVARLGAYRNVWWSLANEFDFMKQKKMSDWDRFGDILVKNDPYRRLRSIHNGTRIYNHTQPWVTHASIQNGYAVADFGRATLYRDVYEKPIVFDEAKYEGNIPQRWGNLSAEEMVHRFWQGAIAGTYTGHGETYTHPENIIWWAKGGELHGQSPARIAFMRKILEEGPPEGLEPIDKWQDDHTCGKKGEYYLIYFGKEQPTEWQPSLPNAKLDRNLTLNAEVLDTWEMTTKPVEGVLNFHLDKAKYRLVSDAAPIPLPGKPYIAIRLKNALPKLE